MIKCSSTSFIRRMSQLDALEERLYAMQQQVATLETQLVEKEKELKEALNKNKMIETQLSTVEDQYEAMKDTYTSTIERLKKKIDSHGDPGAQGDHMIQAQDYESDKHRKQHSDQVDDVFQSIERLKGANQRLFEENQQLTDLMSHRMVRQSLSNIDITHIEQEKDPSLIATFKRLFQ